MYGTVLVTVGIGCVEGTSRLATTCPARSIVPKQYPRARAASMISGTLSTVAWPAGESTGPSWSRIATPGRSPATIPLAICVAERDGSQSVAEIGFGVTVKPVAAMAACVAALTLRNGGRTTLKV